MSHQFLVVDYDDNLEVDLNIPLILDDNFEYEMALICFTTYNTIFNITKEMNIFAINDKEEKIEAGAYEVKEISNKLEKYGISLNPDQSTVKCNMKIKDKILKFNDNSFFYKILGFDFKKTYLPGDYYSDNNVDISKINMINILCDLVQGNFIVRHGDNNSRVNLLYSFPANSVKVGFKIIERPPFPIYCRVKEKYINGFKFKIVDENLDPIDFNREKVSILVHLRKC